MRIYPRNEVGLKKPFKSLPSLRLPVADVFLHHSVTAVTSDPFADWRNIQDIAFSRGYLDISYSYGVHSSIRDGVMEGRGLKEGAHTEGHNSTSFGICLVGNYEATNLPDSMVDCVRWVVSELKEQGQLKDAAILQPHKLVYATACPGQYAVRKLDAMRIPWGTEEDDVQRFFPDHRGVDDKGADSFWEVVFPDGDIKNWNGARQLPSLRDLAPNHVPITGAYLDPSGDGLVLVGNDPHQEPDGHWITSTYKIMVK